MQQRLKIIHIIWLINETAATVIYELTINNQYYFEILSKIIIKQLCIRLNILKDEKLLIGVLAR